jgi:hypothetical protein
MVAAIIRSRVEKRKFMKLSDYSNNITSQYGEDGILEEIIRVIGTEIPKNCVEFGAWDGKHLSNTWALVNKSDWKVIYIEADESRFNSLKRSTANNPNICAISAFVTDDSKPKSSLRTLLEGVKAPKNIGILSIDIDGNDYNVWRDFNGFDVSVVVIEYNHTIPPSVEFVDDGGRSFMGSSALAITRLARLKGYSLVACTLANCIFVRDDLFARFRIMDNSVDTLMPKDGITFVCRNFAGEVVFSQKQVIEPIVKLIVYKRIKKWLKFLVMGRKSFHYLGDKY